MKKYYCSKHGNIGHPDCKECWDNLKRLCDDKNTLLVGEESLNVHKTNSEGKK